MPDHVREVPFARVLVEQLEHPEPERRHAGRPRDALRRERLEQALRVEVRPGEDDSRAGDRGEVRVAPGVRVEHRHDRADRVRLARCRSPSGLPDGDAERVQHGRAVRVDDALRPCRSCRSCSTWPLPRPRRAPGRATRPGRPWRAAPRTSPRPRGRARSPSASRICSASGSSSRRRSRPVAGVARDRSRCRPGCRRMLSVCRTSPPHGIPKYASRCGSGSSRASRPGRRARARARRARRRAASPAAPCPRTCSGGRMRSGRRVTTSWSPKHVSDAAQHRRQRQLEVHHQAVHRAPPPRSWSYRPGTAYSRNSRLRKPGRASGPGSRSMRCADVRVAPHEAARARARVAVSARSTTARDGLGRRAVRAALGSAILRNAAARSPYSSADARPACSASSTARAPPRAPDRRSGSCPARRSRRRCPTARARPQRVGDRLQRVLRSGVWADERQRASTRRPTR